VGGELWGEEGFWSETARVMVKDLKEKAGRIGFGGENRRAEKKTEEGPYARADFRGKRSN